MTDDADFEQMEQAERAEAEKQKRNAMLLQQKRLNAAKRMRRLLRARESLLDYTVLSMPDPKDPDDPTKSRYNPQAVHKLLCEKLEAVERGEITRLIVNVHPRIGKSELVSKRFPTWFVGRDPYRQVITSGYSDDFVSEFGREAREIMRSPFYQQVFPGTSLMKGAQSVERLQTTQGGVMTFAGVGGSITGKGADCLPAGTLVETDQGPVRIEELMGNASPCKVLAYETDTERLVYKDLEAVANRQADGVYRITTARGRVVEATENHPFFTSEGYVNAGSITPGCRLLCAVQEKDGSPRHRFRTESDEVVLVEQIRGEATVYDIQVADTHNFFANGICVHNCLILDDPVKGRAAVSSRRLRDRDWNWFTQDAMSRLMGAMGRVIICMTRWHEDDIVGRLLDPNNPHYNPVEAAKWNVVNLPAWCEDEAQAEADPLGREVGEVMWPERITKEFLEGQRRLDPAGFEALYMGRPAPPDGDFFKADHLRLYNDPTELPDNLRFYAASDHAVSLAEGRDKTCMGVVGVDEDDNIWILPDLVWRQMDAEAQVDSMLGLMRQHHPLLWWAEKGHISQSLGPFLRKRMQEEQTYSAIVEKTPVRDKQSRAQAIQGRMAMGKVFFPAFAGWWNDAKEQMLNFPYGTHDDFCLDGDSRVLMADGTEKPLSAVAKGELVATPTGSAEVIAAAMTNADAEVFRVRFSDGTSLVGTGNHPVHTSQGFVRLDSLPLSGTVTAIDRHQQTASDKWRDEALQKAKSWDTEGSSLKGPRRTALSAGLSSLTRSGRRDIAPSSAGRKTVTSVERLSEKQPVYNLTVAGAHVYYANGVLTHNCDFLAWIGIGLSQLSPASRKLPKTREIQTGSVQWILQSSKRIMARQSGADSNRYLN